MITPNDTDKSRFRSAMNIIDKTSIFHTFKVGILFIGPTQDKEEEYIANSFPESGLFPMFVNGLGEKIGDSTFAKSLGNDLIHYRIGPLIPRSQNNAFEVKRIVCNVPTLIIWNQNPNHVPFESIKSQFTRDIVVIEEMPNGLLRIRAIRKIEEHKMESVYKPDGIMTLGAILGSIHGYIFNSQMELNPAIIQSLGKNYSTIAPYLEARKTKLRDVKEAFSSKPMDLEAVAELVAESRFSSSSQQI